MAEPWDVFRSKMKRMLNGKTLENTSFKEIYNLAKEEGYLAATADMETGALEELERAKAAGDTDVDDWITDEAESYLGDDGLSVVYESIEADWIDTKKNIQNRWRKNYLRNPEPGYEPTSRDEDWELNLVFNACVAGVIDGHLEFARDYMKS